MIIVRKAPFLFMTFILLFLTACGENTVQPETNESSENQNDKKIVEASDIQELYTNPKKFKGYTYDFTAKVFTTPEKDNEVIVIQAWAKPEESELNTIITVNDSSIEVNDGDYLHVKGKVKDVFKGENLMGGKIEAPIIVAEEIEVIDYATAIAPTIETIEINEEIDQKGFIVSLEKLEIAKPHSRLYLKVSNKSNHKISFFSHSVKMTSGEKQFEEEYVYDANYPEIQSEILPGASSEGIIVFPSLDESISRLKVYADGYSDNYDIDIEPFIFEFER